MTDRTVRATVLVALALSAVLDLYAWSLVEQARRLVVTAAAEAVITRALLDRKDRELAESKAELARMLEAERERARRAGRAPWRERID